MEIYAKVNKQGLRLIEEITNAKYHIKNDLILLDNVDGIIEDLIDEIYKLRDKIEELEEDIQENYRPVPVAEQVAISDNDFI